MWMGLKMLELFLEFFFFNNKQYVMHIFFPRGQTDSMKHNNDEFRGDAAPFLPSVR
jgi:hypothetical protein